MNARAPGEFEIVATRSMFELKPDSFEFVLSDRARTFIADNDLGEFKLRFDDEQESLIVIAPSDYARTLFRLSL